MGILLFNVYDMARGSSILFKITKKEAAERYKKSLYTMNRIFRLLTNTERLDKFIVDNAPVISGELVTVADASERLGKRPRVINKYISEGKLATYTLGGATYICFEQLLFLISNTK